MCDTLTIEIGIGRDLDRPFDEVLEKTQQELAREGFGILSRIDVHEKLKEKLGVDFPRFVILGACHPPSAHKVLTVAPQVGLMLPCNVVVRDLGGGRTRLEAVNAEAMAQLFPEADLAETPGEVAEMLERAVAAV
jgi:uncharacterized protein (DUF302 family)